MEFQNAETDCVELAKKDVANQLNRPEALERLDQYKRKISRKKASVESQLRNAVQTQLDGVQKGLQTLQDLGKVMKEVREEVSEVERLYMDCAELAEVVTPIKEVNRKHQQLTTTTGHINNIFNVPTIVKETHQLIEDGQLLEAHRKLAELEHTRDELFIQLYQSEDAFVDKNTSLHHYFEPLHSLSDALGQQLWLVMNQVTGLVATEPTRVVTALRIVEREEKTDGIVKMVLVERGIPHSQIPGRPKNWKQKCLHMLDSSISNRYGELNPSEEEKMENKTWLISYLEEVAKFAFTDLKEIKGVGEKCFPPSYEIVDYFIKTHHANLARVISKLVSDDPNARDIIPLMLWIGDIRDSFNEVLEIDLSVYGQLINHETEVQLQGRCQKQVEDNLQELVVKMADLERTDIFGFNNPEVDMDDHYYTTVGITLFQMVDENISALSPLGIKNKYKIMTICLNAIMKFQGYYKQILEECHSQHMATIKKQPPQYYSQVTAAANNCRSCIDFADQLKQRLKVDTDQTTLDAEHEVGFKKISEEFESIAHFCCDCLVDSAFFDLKPVFAEFFMKDVWLSKKDDLMSKVEGTLYDYNNDFKFLKQAYHSYVIIEAQHRAVFNYMQAFLSKRMVLKKDGERGKAAEQVKDDAKKMSNCFLRLSHATNPKYTAVIEEMAELLRCKQEYLAMDIAGLANKHPDIRVNHVVAVLAMRGDLNRGLVQKIIQQTALREQQGDELPSKGVAPGSLVGGRVTANMRKKQEEKVLFQSLPIPNPYSLVGK